MVADVVDIKIWIALILFFSVIMKIQLTVSFLCLCTYFEKKSLNSEGNR